MRRKVRHGKRKKAKAKGMKVGRKTCKEYLTRDAKGREATRKAKSVLDDDGCVRGTGRLIAGRIVMGTTCGGCGWRCTRMVRLLALRIMFV